MNKLTKEQMVIANEYIRITKKYYKTSDKDVMLDMFGVKDKLGKSLDNIKSWTLIDLISSLAKSAHLQNKTYKDIYNAINAFYGKEILWSEE